MRRRYTSLGLLLAALALPTLGIAGQPFAFAALGCMPYGRMPDSGPSFARVIAEINRHTPAFTVHLGDILGSDERVTDAVLIQRRSDFNTFNSALIYTPGDNEWTDAHSNNAGRYEPLERLARIRQIFFAEERSLGRQPIALVTQRQDPGFEKFSENARWTHERIVFATVHVVGSRNNHQTEISGALAEHDERDAANAAWIRATFAAARETSAPGLVLFFQANPFAADRRKAGYGEGFGHFLQTIEACLHDYDRPVLLIHADEHRFRLDRGMRFHAAGEVWPNVTRMETFGAQDFHAVLVSVDPDSRQVFLPGPLIVPGNARPVLRYRNDPP